MPPSRNTDEAPGGGLVDYANSEDDDSGGDGGSDEDESPPAYALGSADDPVGRSRIGVSKFFSVLQVELLQLVTAFVAGCGAVDDRS